jgi:exo-1,4-beta-D-glucosaminidase
MTRATRLAPVLAVLFAIGLGPEESWAAPPAGPAQLMLDKGWDLQTSANVRAPGSELSTPAYKPNGWHNITVPTTVVGALVKNKVFPDPYFGMNIRGIPGTTYKIGSNFSNTEMTADSPFAVPWWYRKQFRLPPSYKGKTVWLTFEALNFRANVWLNGKQIGSATDVAGAWRRFEFDVTQAARPGAVNVLAVEVFPQKKDDLGITFVDWNPVPPDKNMGLWKEVYLTSSGPVSVRHPAVISKLHAPANDNAALTVTAVLRNASDKPVSGKLVAKIEKVRVEQEVTLGPFERKDVTFEPTDHPLLNLQQPRLWWPAQMGKPELYDLRLDFVVDGRTSDWAATPFGIREVHSELDANKRLVFSVNGKKVLIRGGGWSSDMMMRADPKRHEDELRYVLDMGLNTVRLEGKIETDHFLDYADRNGILVMAGWCCCDHWEKWSNWKSVDHIISAESQRDQLLRLRRHPSVFVWLNASDIPPPAAVEKRYLEIASAVRWPNPTISSAAQKQAEFSGPSGVKMLGPYEWVPPRYWLEDTKKGGAYGFNTETSPGPAVPPLESLRKMLPPDKLWPINEYWDFHAGGGQFSNIKVHTDALNNRYGEAKTVEDYTVKSQLMAYEGIRAMFEGFSRNKYQSTGVIQWMLNNAWPSIIWHLYDYYLRPGGGYFGAKKANQPLHAIYSETDGSVWAVNSTYQDVPGLRVKARVFNLDMNEKHTTEATFDLPADGTHKAFTLPSIPGLTTTYFVHLAIFDNKQEMVGSNFYWQSTKQDVLDHGKAKWFVTPTKSYADFTALAQLPQVNVRVASKSQRQAAGRTLTTVRLENPSRSLAFFVRLKVNKGKGGDEVLPVLWQDNYVSLLPGERREISASYRTADLEGKRPEVEVTGWNVTTVLM